MQKLNLGKSHVVGFSYGGCSTLFLALKHPELVRTLTLTEPALIPWLSNLSVPRTEEGEAVLADYTNKLLEPAGEAYRKEDSEATLRITLDYLVRKGMYDEAPPQLRDVWLRNVRELGAILTSPRGLAAPEQERVRALRVAGGRGGTMRLFRITSREQIRAEPTWWRSVAKERPTHADVFRSSSKKQRISFDRRP